MSLCESIVYSKPITWISGTENINLIKSPMELKYALALRTARQIDPDTLEASISRTSYGCGSIYTRQQLNNFAIDLGGSVRGDKERIINYIRMRLKELA